MSRSDWQKIETIIDRAITLPEEQRKIYIEEQCKGDPELKGEITELLQSIFDSEGWLENPGEFKQDLYEDLSDGIASLPSAESLIGEQVGSYTIHKKLGEGGMGTVYLARRSDGEFEHQVAIKIIRHERATQKNILRFKREQSILAGLNHPGIAKLFDGGITQEGFPYIIMEYVDGTPLTTYCNRHNSPLAERLELFEQVLQAIRHAHENLVIHRDLKPGNILVNSSGKIKILDFGISKLLEDTNDNNLGITREGSLLLTPRYAAPEQIKEELITTATDLYALGTVLYELLAGTHPFDVQDRTRYELENIIVRDEPVPPSLKVADNNPITPKQLQGDLDAIILKSLCKQPRHRYRVANELLDDLKNYRRGIPVSAREGSITYRTGKFINRHRQGVIATAGVVLLMIGFITFYTLRITEERNQARIEAEKAREVTDFVVTLLEQNYPENSQGDTVTVREILDQSVTRIDELDKSPAIKAKLLQVIGHAYRSVGESKKAQPLLKQSIEVLESNHIQNLDLARTYDVSGIIVRDLGDYDQAQKYLEKSVALYRQLEKTETAVYAKALKNLAYILRLQSDYARATELVEESLTVEKQLYEMPDVNIAETLFILASIYRYQGKYNLAIEKQQASLNMLLELIDGPHPGISANYSNLGTLFEIQNNNRQAKHFYLKALDMSKTLFGENHPEIATTSSNLSDIYLEEGKFDSAKILIERSIDITREKYGKDHPRMADYLDAHAQYFIAKKEYPRADSVYREALRILYSRYDGNHPKIADLLSNRAHVFYLQGQYKASVDLYRQSLHIKQQHFENSNPKVQKTIGVLVDLLRETKHTAEADSLARLMVSHSR